MTNRKVRLLLPIAAVTAAVLTALPSTGWIVRQQIRLNAGQRLPPYDELGIDHPKGADPRLFAAADRCPADFDRQIGAALLHEGDEQVPGADGTTHPVAQALLRLRQRFGDRPVLLAHILRYLTTGDLKIARDADELVLLTPQLQVEMAKPSVQAQSQPSKPAVLALAAEIAGRGEQLDPGNAYFPAMRAVALFGEHHDDEALAALDAAANAPRWNDYAGDEVHCVLALQTDVHGHPSAIEEAADQAAVLLPHLSRVRGAARIATSLAIRRELAGDTAGGLRIRRSVARLGALLRSRSTLGIDSLVGVALAQLSAARPGGAPALSTTGDAATSKKRAHYVDYLMKIGASNEARWFAAECANDDVARTITQSATDNNSEISSVSGLVLFWLGDSYLLLSTLWVLVLGGFAAMFAQIRQIREGRPLVSGIGASAMSVAAILTGLVVVLCCLAGDIVVGTGNAGSDALIAVAVAAVLSGFPMYRLVRGRSTRQTMIDLVRGAAALMAVLAGLFALGGLAVWMSCGLDSLVCAFAFLGSGCDTMADSDGWQRLAEGLSVFAIPVGTAVAVAIRSRSRRVPLTVGVSRGLRDSALPIAGTLLLLYVAALTATGIAETYAHHANQAVIANENQYNADRAHKTWPDLVPAGGTE